MPDETNQPVGSGYGYTSDEAKISPFNFGLNPGNTYLTKFEWIPNAGKDGAEQEALDVVFNINGTDKSYRLFPIVKAFGKNTNEEITDPNAPEFKEAIKDLNAVVTHILHVFKDSETIQAAFSRPINSFKEFATIAASILPKDFNTVPLDIFLQWQWSMDDNQNRTFLEIPKKMKYGRWLSKAIPGNWKEERVENPTDATREALYYVNEAGEKHPIFKNGWFMNSKFANQQRREGAENSNAGSSTVSTTQAATQTQQDGQANAKASAW